MRIRRQTFAALLLTLLGLVWLDGTFARGDEARATTKTVSVTASRVLAEESDRQDLFAEELKKRQLFEDRVAICRDFAPSGQSAQTSRAGQNEFARDTNSELVFLGLAELRPVFLPLADIVAPEPPSLALPPSRSPPSR